LGAWRALEQIQSDSTKGQQQVFRTLGQLVLDAARVQELQQVEAAGHVACVAAAQARQQLAAKQQQLEQERESIRQEQQQLEQQRAELAAERQRMQLERESLQAERQQLQLLRAQVDRSGQRKRRHL
jgi:predicted amino acid dehydrogenase